VGELQPPGATAQGGQRLALDADEVEVEVEDPKAKKWKIFAELARDLVSSKNENRCETDQALDVDKVETPGA
jgi:hypothetical protein